MTSNVNNQQLLPCLFNLPRDIGEHIVSHIDRPKDLLNLAETNKQNREFFIHTGGTNQVPSEMEKRMYSIFSNLGLRCPPPDCNNSVQNFLKTNKKLISKLLKGNITDSNEDIRELAQTSQTELIRKVFESSLAKHTDQNQWATYSTFTSLINDSFIPMDVRDEIYYGAASSEKCNPQRLALKGTMATRSRILDRATQECNIIYIKNRFKDFTPDRLATIFEKSIEKYYLTKQEMYREFWKELLASQIIKDDRNKLNGLMITAEYGDTDSFLTIFKTLSSIPTNDSLEEIIFTAAIHKQSKFLKTIIKFKPFADNISELLEFRWVLPAIELRDISDVTIGMWLENVISNKKQYSGLTTYRHIPWSQGMYEALQQPDTSLPYFLIKNDRRFALETFANLGKLKSGRYPSCTPVRLRSQHHAAMLPTSVIMPPLLQQVDRPHLNYNMPQAYEIKEPQKEVLSESTPLIKEIFSKNDKHIGNKLAFLSANGYAETVEILLSFNKATPNEIGEALVQAVSYRCLLVVDCILSSKPLPIVKEAIDSSEELVPLDYYKKCLRIAATSGFTEIFILLLRNLPNEPNILEEPLLDALIFGNEDIANKILERNSNISIETIESCLIALCQNLLEIIAFHSLVHKHSNILIQMLERIPPKQISQCNPSILIETLKKLITLDEEKLFIKLLAHIPPIYLKNEVSSLMQLAIASKKEGIIEQLFNLKHNLKRVLENDTTCQK